VILTALHKRIYNLDFLFVVTLSLEEFFKVEIEFLFSADLLGVVLFFKFELFVEVALFFGVGMAFEVEGVACFKVELFSEVELFFEVELFSNVALLFAIFFEADTFFEVLFAEVDLFFEVELFLGVVFS
jgi:hypothetical protein